MIYLVTALYAEAHPFITRFQLKKDSSHTRFQIFLNGETDLCLIISGTGQIPAATALGSICTEYKAGPGDFLLNVGVCAQVRTNGYAKDAAGNAFPPGTLFLCNKIKEQATGRTFYPDLLYQHKFAEAQILTGAKPYKATTALSSVDNSQADDIYPLLYDMEAAAIYQAGAYYFGPHQMSFLKVISDTGNTESVTAQLIEGLLGQNMDDIAEYIATLRAAEEETHREDPVYKSAMPQNPIRKNAMPPDPVCENTMPQNPIYKSVMPQSPEQLCRDLHCSRTMSNSVRQHLCYWILSDVDYLRVLEEMYLEGKLPCKDKREGKQRFEELKERLL